MALETVLAIAVLILGVIVAAGFVIVISLLRQTGATLRPSLRAGRPAAGVRVPTPPVTESSRMTTMGAWSSSGSATAVPIPITACPGARGCGSRRLRSVWMSW